MPSFPQRVLTGAALLVCALASPAFAADRGAVPAGAPRADLAAVRAQRTALVASRKPTSATTSASAAGAASTGITASSYRAYPPSCFSDTLPTQANLIQPLPVTPTGLVYSQTVALATNSQNTSENVTIKIWRVACSSVVDKLDGSSYGGAAYNPDGGYVGATLMRIQRQEQYEGDWQIYPLFPDIHIAQGNIVFDNVNQTDLVRVANEPNTLLGDTTLDSPVINSTTYVLENYASPTLGFFYFNNAFTIRFDNGYPNGRTTINVPDYNPTQQTYPAAFQPMPINGYFTGSWYVPGHGGEGMLTQVFDNNDGATRTFFLTWYTFDNLGLPFWLVAQTSFPIGTTQLTNVPVYYATNGGFAQNYTKTTTNTWGMMNLSFPDCQHIKFDYNGSTGTVSGGPGGASTSSLLWTRLIGNGGGINNLTCQ